MAAFRLAAALVIVALGLALFGLELAGARAAASALGWVLVFAGVAVLAAEWIHRRRRRL